MKPSKSLQDKLQQILQSQQYVVRYEKGNFRGGYCHIMDQRTIIINKFHPLESKINALQQIIREIDIDFEQLENAQANMVQKIKKDKL